MDVFLGSDTDEKRPSPKKGRVIPRDNSSLKTNKNKLIPRQSISKAEKGGVNTDSSTQSSATGSGSDSGSDSESEKKPIKQAARKVRKDEKKSSRDKEFSVIYSEDRYVSKDGTRIPGYKRLNLAQQLRESSDEGVLDKDREDDIPLHRQNFLVVITMIVLLGIRPRRLQFRLLKESAETVWTDVKNSLIKRWQTLAVVSGLMLAATGTLTGNPDHLLPYTIAYAGRCSSFVSILFSVGLNLAFADASPKDFARLARSPLEMLVVLSAPAFFVMLSMFCFYGSLLSNAWTSDAIAPKIVGTAFGAVATLLIIYCTTIAYKVADQRRSD